MGIRFTGFFFQNDYEMGGNGNVSNYSTGYSVEIIVAPNIFMLQLFYIAITKKTLIVIYNTCKPN